jgi:hypothetical protein
MYIINEEFQNTFICNNLDGEDKICRFCQPINHNNLDLIKRLGSWEVNVMKFIENDDPGLLAMGVVVINHMVDGVMLLHKHRTYKCK